MDEYESQCLRGQIKPTTETKSMGCESVVLLVEIEAFAPFATASLDISDILLRPTLPLTFNGRKQCNKSDSTLQLSQPVL